MKRCQSVTISQQSAGVRVIRITTYSIRTVSNIEQAEGTFSLMMMSPGKPRQGPPSVFFTGKRNGMSVATASTTYLVKLKVIAGSSIGSVRAIPVASGGKQAPTEDGRGL